MGKKMWFIIAGILAVFGVLIGVSILQNREEKLDYDYATLIEPGEESGGIAENVTGERDAPVLIFEYGDYQCTACAPMNPYINDLVEEYDGKVAVVFRTDIMSYHQNGTAAASAAEAAALQGYWKPYKDMLFENQNDWYYSDASKRQEQFEEYFTKVSNGKGDMKKFREDMGSEAVKKKIEFDAKLSDNMKIQWTPTFYVGDELIDQRNITRDEFLNKLREKIDAKLEEKGIEK